MTETKVGCVDEQMGREDGNEELRWTARKELKAREDSIRKCTGRAL